MSQIATYSGHLLDLMSPDDEAIDPCDIAHTLSQICRFNGRTREFYSVAQHNCMVCDLVPAQDKLAALLKDAPAAYMGDLLRPLKKMIGLAEDIEDDLWQAVCRRFDLYPMLPDSVSEAERVVTVTEMRDLMNIPLMPGQSHNYIAGLPEQIRPWAPAEARTQFLDRFLDLLTDPATPESYGTSSLPDGCDLHGRPSA